MGLRRMGLFGLTLTYSVLILALTAGNGNNKLFCFKTSDVFRIRKNFLSCAHAHKGLEVIFTPGFLQQHQKL